MGGTAASPHEPPPFAVPFRAEKKGHTGETSFSPWQCEREAAYLPLAWKRRTAGDLRQGGHCADRSNRRPYGDPCRGSCVVALLTPPRVGLNPRAFALADDRPRRRVAAVRRHACPRIERPSLALGRPCRRRSRTAERARSGREQRAEAEGEDVH